MLPVGLSSVSIGPVELRFAGLGTGDCLLVGSFGCPLRCRFCMNHDVSHRDPMALSLDCAEFIASRARDLRGVIFTHSEPLAVPSLVSEVRSMTDGFVAVKTSAHCEESEFESFLGSVDAVNVDVKGDETAYRELCGGDFGKVLRNIELASRSGKLVELTFLVIPGMEKGLDRAMSRVARIAPGATAWVVGFVPSNLMMDWPMARRRHVDDAVNRLSGLFKEVRNPHSNPASRAE